MFNTHHSKLMAGAVLASAMLAGCGSSDSSDHAGPGPNPPDPQPPVQQTITAVADYVRDLIAGSTADNTAPRDINGLTLATDDQAAPAMVN